MPRRRKLGAVPALDNADEVAAFERMEPALRVMLARIDRYNAGVDQALATGEMTPALLKGAADLARVSVSISAEIRHLEKHTRDKVRAMTPEELDKVVITRCKTMTRERRQSIRDLLDELDREDQVLSL